MTNQLFLCQRLMAAVCTGFTAGSQKRVLAGLVLGLAASTALADYPDRPVRVILPAAPGGGADTVLRLLCNELATRLGQPFIIDNKPGASGTIGLNTVAKAPADGYTLGVTNLAIVVASLSNGNAPYNVVKDFTPIAKTHSQTNVLVVGNSLPVKSVAELVAYAKARPSKVFYGSSGNGTSLHVVTELFRNANGIQLTHVPYRSAPYGEADLVAGQIQMMITNLTSIYPHIQSGRVRALAVTSPARSPLLPSVPTIAESGTPAAKMVTWGGIVAPRNLPKNVVQKLNKAIADTLAEPRVKKRILELGYEDEPHFMSSDEFGQFITAQAGKWSGVIRENRITLN